MGSLLFSAVLDNSAPAHRILRDFTELKVLLVLCLLPNNINDVSPWTLSMTNIKTAFFS